VYSVEWPIAKSGSSYTRRDVKLILATFVETTRRDWGRIELGIVSRLLVVVSIYFVFASGCSLSICSITTWPGFRPLMRSMWRRPLHISKSKRQSSRIARVL
jgi:hypothetical protein